MIFNAQTDFPANTIRVYLLSTDTLIAEHAIIQDFPGAATAWEKIPNQKYRTLFGANGEVAYLFKIDTDASLTSIQRIGRKLSYRESERLATSLAIKNELPLDQLTAFFHGLLLGTYTVGRYKSEQKKHPLSDASVTIHLIGSGDEELEALDRIYQRADTQMRCMDLVNAPANKKRPQDLAAWAIDSGDRFDYNVRVLDKGRCETEGMHAFLAVNRGSEDPARFIIMEYKGDGAPEKPEVLIGKGVTFDTGGISIKGSANLHLMKSDMGGAAAVFGTLESCARLKLPVHVVGLVPVTDNSVDALSVKPSDVINSHSGLTIEIIDTDAEGRLIMCDALSYGATHYDANTLIDIATLTGSAVRTFGYECAALFSKDEALVAELRTAGDKSGERCWPLPMWDAYDNLKSDVADVKNYSGKPISGAIDAAKFLEKFTHNHPRFAHLDIAGVALKAGPYASDRLATGFGIGLLLNWLESNSLTA